MIALEIYEATTTFQQNRAMVWRGLLLVNLGGLPQSRIDPVSGNVNYIIGDGGPGSPYVAGRFVH